MRKLRGGQIRANRLIGPRGEVVQAPCTGRSGASWIWATPLHTGASEGSSVPLAFQEQSLFITERRTAEKVVSEDGYSSFLFNPLCGDFQLSPRELEVDPINWNHSAAFLRWTP